MAICRCAGIDPGNQGAIVLLEMGENHRKIIDAFDMPTVKEQVKAGRKVRTEPDFDEMMEICERIAAYNPDLVTMEQVWGQPQDSAMTAFALGGWYRMLRYCLHQAGYSLHRQGDSRWVRGQYVLSPPAQWKQWQEWSRWGLWGAGDYAKDISIEMVRDLFPADFESKMRPLRKGSTTRRNKPRDGRTDATLIGMFGYHLTHPHVPFLTHPKKWVVNTVVPKGELVRI